MPVNIFPVLVAARSRAMTRTANGWQAEDSSVFPDEVVDGLCAAGWLEHLNTTVHITALGEQQLKTLEKAMAI